jgi:hypothetical protein
MTLHKIGLHEFKLQVSSALSDPSMLNKPNPFVSKAEWSSDCNHHRSTYIGYHGYIS